MTGRTMLAALAVAMILATAVPMAAHAQARVEYIDIRWDGVEKLCVIYGDGRVEFISDSVDPALWRTFSLLKPE